jgi:hypothetical protein
MRSCAGARFRTRCRSPCPCCQSVDAGSQSRCGCRSVGSSSPMRPRHTSVGRHPAAYSPCGTRRSHRSELAAGGGGFVGVGGFSSCRAFSASTTPTISSDLQRNHGERARHTPAALRCIVPRSSVLKRLPPVSKVEAVSTGPFHSAARNQDPASGMMISKATHAISTAASAANLSADIDRPIRRLHCYSVTSSPVMEG